MNVELSKEDLVLIEYAARKGRRRNTGLKFTIVENHEYKDFLKEREKHVGDLLASVKNALAAVK